MLKVLTLIIFLVFFFRSILAAEIKVCDSIIIQSDDNEIDLTETEKKLVCGEKHGAYENIPAYQASFFLTAFLQSRGFLRPQFKQVNNVLYVDTGPLILLGDIVIEPEDSKNHKEIKRDLKRRFRDEVLNPKLIDAVKKRAARILNENGFACADPQSVVNAATGTISTALNAGKKFNFGEVKKEKIPGLKENALDRYYPFEPDQVFDEKLLELNEKRLLRADVVQGTYFLKNCAPEMEGLVLSQFFIPSPARTLRFGLGASTEQGPMARLRWSNNRFQSMASVLSLQAQASFRNQSLNLAADSFVWPNQPRRSLVSGINLSRESQIDFEQSLLNVTSRMKWTKDSNYYFQSYTLGPSYEGSTYSTQQSSDTNSYSTLILGGSAQWISHKYEYYDFHPQEGNLIAFQIDFRDPSLGFSDTLLRLDSSYAHLYEITPWGKGALVGGMRLNAGTSWVDERVSLNSLPPSVKFYGGGSDDIRGFLLNTLPDNKGAGALSKLGLKLELRRTYLFQESLEGFTFVDGAYFGETSWMLDKRLWYSPGIGIRWLTRLGLVQTYVARGLATKPYKDSGNFYYLGIGGTF